MAKIYRRTDRIKVKIDDVVITLAPMSIDQKIQVQELTIQGQVKRDLRASTKAIALAMKFSIKAVDGIEDSEGNPYKLQFEGEELSDECVNDLYELNFLPKMAVVCSTLAGGVPENFETLEGVEILKTVKKEDTDPNV